MANARPRTRKATPRATRSYDAAATSRRILDAAIGVLADKGFTGLGVNALAAAAGVDKQLVYYHFGGLDGVVRALGGELDLWLGAPLQPRAGEAYGAAVQRLLLEYTSALRGNRLVQRLLAWELVEPSEALRALEGARSHAMEGWVAGLRSAAAPAPEGIDAPAINAVLLAALNYLALREHSVGSFAGMDIGGPQGAQRLAQAVAAITQAVYGETGQTTDGRTATALPHTLSLPTARKRPAP